MSQSELVEDLAYETGFTKSHCLRFLHGLLSVSEKRLRAGKEVSVSGLLTIKPVFKGERSGNSGMGAWSRPAEYVPRIKLSQTLKRNATVPADLAWVEPPVPQGPGSNTGSLDGAQ